MTIQEPIFIEPKRGPGRPRKDGKPAGELAMSAKERFDRLVEQAHAVQPNSQRTIQFGKILIKLRDVYFSAHLDPSQEFIKNNPGRRIKNTYRSNSARLMHQGIEQFSVWASKEFNMSIPSIKSYIRWGQNPDSYYRDKLLINERGKRTKSALKILSAPSGSRALDIAKAAFEKLSIVQRHEFYDWITERMESN